MSGGATSRRGLWGRERFVAGIRWAVFFSLSFLQTAPCDSLSAENLISRPVGFVRLTSGPGVTLASSPFHALAPLSNAVLMWDAVSQQYVSTSSVTPGQGFWLESAESQNVFVAGEVVLDETWRAVLYPSLNLVGYSYASNGLYATRDQLGQYTLYSRDDAGRVTAVQDPLGRIVQYEYDFAGRMTKLTDPNGNETGFQYDLQNNLVAKTYADESTWQYAYDPNNSLTNTINGRGEQIRYVYGPLNNLLSILSSNLSISLSYDILGRVTGRVDSAGTTVMKYGDLVHLTEADGPFSNDTIAYSYDGDLKKTVTLNGNQQVEYEWDFLDRLSQVATPTGTFAYVYEGVRRTPREIQYPSGAKVLRSSDNLARLTSVSNYYSDDGAVSACAYVYDSGGRRTRETRLGGEYIDYGYDLAGQLTSAVKRLPGGQPAPGYGYFYTYDPAGNMLTNVGNGLRIAMAYNDLNQLVSRGWGESPTSIVVWGSASPIVTSATVNALGADLQSNGSFVATSVGVELGTNTLTALGRDIYGRVATNVSKVVIVSGRAFSYDANGNLLSDGYFTNTWNALDQQIAYEQGSNRMEFTYDGVGRRVEKTEILGSVTNVTRYVWDGWLPLAILDASNNTVELNTWGLDLSDSLEGAGGIGGLLCVRAPDSADPARECFGNGRGDVTDLITGGSNGCARYEYEPFGASPAVAGPGSCRYRFSSKELDDVSGGYYYGFRFFSPQLARWLNRDPIEEAGGLNVYAFLDNAPIDYVDELGLSGQNPCGSRKMAEASSSHMVGLLALWHRVNHDEWFWNYFGFTFSCNSKEKATGATIAEVEGKWYNTAVSHLYYSLANPAWMPGYPRYYCGGGEGKVSVQTRIWLTGWLPGYNIFMTLKSTVVVCYECKCDEKCP